MLGTSGDLAFKLYSHIEASEAILSDLIEYEAVFVMLAQKKSKWHFAIDF